LEDIEKTKYELLGSLLLFTQTFYKLRTGRDFELSHPIGRESHYITICRELTSFFKLETKRVIINIPPGHGKSVLLKHFIAWALAHYPDSNFLYISHTHSLAATHTAEIKEILSMPHYKKLFGIEIRRDSSAKDNFKTMAGGCVRAYGSKGAVTGQDAVLPNLSRFSGCVIMDDMHEPDEVHSPTIRETVKRIYNQTIKPRPRGNNVGFIFIGQRLHQLDLAGFLLSGEDGYQWKKIVLKAIDDAGNVLDEEKKSKQDWLIEKAKNKYMFWSQGQQEPQPDGGGIFVGADFPLLDYEPNYLATFITADTAETSKDANDATVFSFWGLYKIIQNEIETDIYGLHWIDCREIRIEPKDLHSEFMDFYAKCMRNCKVKPYMAAIEKKSTGVTLLSVLKEMQGLKVIDIERTKASGNKTARFLSIQHIQASKRISLPMDGEHTKKCITHCESITNNATQAHDDIADTLYDAVKIALIDQTVIYQTNPNRVNDEELAQRIMAPFQKVQQIRQNSRW